MRIYFLDNSGFAVVLERALLVFDYFNFSPEGGGFEEGVLPESALSDFERVYFFVSHRHSDHFNKRIYSLYRENVKYIVAMGTPKNDVPESRTAMKEGDTFEDGYLRVYAGGSTDMGVSFVADAEGSRIFHAGDLNCWHWQGEWSEKEEGAQRKAFTDALVRLHPHARSIDLAFFPVDPRMKGPYDDGAKEFAARFCPKILVPMHLWGEFAVAERFKEEHESPDMRVIAFSRRGEHIDI